MLSGSEEINELTGRIIGAAIKVHRALGPGLLESAYHACLSFELERAGVSFKSQVDCPIVYEDAVVVEPGYKIDLLIEEAVVVEVKAVEKLLPVHHSQVLTYIKFSGKQVGLLLNFNTSKLADGITRIVNNL